jgi:hypothetical protein
MGRLFIMGILFCCTAPALATLAWAEALEKAGACTRTANAALSACQHEVEDDFWIATGNCINLSDPDARRVCSRRATTARIEGLEECGAQSEARLEICDALGEAPYDPQIKPAMFVNPADIGRSVAPNPYFPMVPGWTWIYRGGTEKITVTVTGRTKKILGVTCAVIRDVVEDRGQVIEDTEDWYAQDIDGNVWYFGEISKEFERGELVGIEGSWKAGVDGAKPGIIMKANPAVGEVFRQEFALGEAEDMGEVLSLNASATVPAASCEGDCLVTKDFTPLEPDALERKYYAPGVGLILEVDPETGERVSLVAIKNPPAGVR